MENSTHEDKKLTLIEEITMAFDGVAREDGITLHEAEAMDDYASIEERAEARRKDAETKWQDVPEEDIFSCSAALSYFDNKSYRYYIPAYIVWYIKYIDRTGHKYQSSISSGSLIFHLTYYFMYDIPQDQLRGVEKFKIFTNEQRRAIAHFLIFAAEQEEEAERRWIKRDFLKGGLEAAYIDKLLQEHKPEDNEMRQALRSYWGQFA